MPTSLRFAVGAVVVGVALVGPSTPAGADPAGPTDYDTEIVSVEPATTGIELRMIGGDSFLELTNLAGAEVLVVGYDGEPYLRFDPDGRVLENERSPSRFLNDDRFAEGTIPPEADADADPVWRQVASDGSYAWHDHRTHWMNRARPPGAEPGDQILEAVVPLMVDGAEVEVLVRSFLQAPPSPLPAIGGVVLGAVVAAVVTVLARRRDRWLALGVGLAAVGALVTGLVAVRSVPAETEPSAAAWLLPLLAVVAVAGAALLGRRSPILADGLVLLAAAEVGLWSWLRRDALGAAILPTDAPFAVERATITFVAVVAVVVGAGRVVSLVRPSP